MIRNSFAIVAAAALAGVAMPAMAQDGAYEYGTYPPPPAVSEVYGAGDYRQGTYPEQGEVQYHGSYPGGPMVHPGAPGAYPMQSPGVPEAYPTAPGLPPMPNLGYTHDDRKAWLADCRTQYYGEGKKKGGIIGGVLGAVTGGIIGHEVTNGSSTRRLGGTLIGAGVGGLAGLAIGAMIGAASDDKKIDECEAYLRRYEGSYGGGYDRDYPAPAYPNSYGCGCGNPAYAYQMVMVPVTYSTRYTYSAPIRREKEIVVEEWVDEEVIETRTVSVPQPTKYVKAPVPTKTIKQPRSTK